MENLDELKEMIQKKSGVNAEFMAELTGHIEQDIRQYKARIKEIENNFTTGSDELEVQLKLLTEEIKQKYAYFFEDGVSGAISKLKTHQKKIEELFQEKSSDVLNKLGSLLESIKNKL